MPLMREQAKLTLVRLAQFLNAAVPTARCLKASSPLFASDTAVRSWVKVTCCKLELPSKAEYLTAVTL